MSPYLFCYGTLMEDGLWAKLTGESPLRDGHATLWGYRKFQVPGEEYPGIATAEHADATVHGVVREIHDSKTWDALDAYEGDDYERIRVPVRCMDGRRIEAFAYTYHPRVTIERLVHRPQWIPQLAEAFYQQWSPLFPGEPQERWEEKLLKNIREKGLGACFVGVLNGKPVASARLVEYDMEGREDLRPWLGGVWVAPELRGCGIGAQLVRAVEREAQENEFKHLYLWTPDRNNFYAKLGYTEKQRTRYLGQTAIIMERELV